MRVSTFLLALPGLFSLSHAWGKPSDCVEGIRTALAEVTFNSSDPEDFWGNLCVNDMIVKTLWISAKLYVCVLYHPVFLIQIEIRSMAPVPIEAVL